MSDMALVQPYADNRRAGSDNRARSPKWTWLRSSRAERERERADAELVSDIHWQWRSACSGTPLAPIIYTPSGATRGVPKIGHVNLGPPISFTVQVRPGQTIDDFIRAAPSIAPSFGAAALEVTPFVQNWVQVVVVVEPRAGIRHRPVETRQY